jgi:hypothetical protein
VYLIGLLFAASAYGFMTDLTHGCLAMGLGLMFGKLFDTYGQHRRALMALKFGSEDAEE